MPRKKPPTDKPPSKEPTASATPPPAKPDGGEVTPDQPVKPITTREKNRVDRRMQAIEGRKFDEQDLGYCAREFVLCGLPYRPQTALKHERTNGTFTLKVVGDPDFGLPFGQDRLIPIWLATAFQEMGRPEDNIIRFRSASDVLRAFHIPPDGHERRMLRARLERIFGATYFVRDNSGKKGDVVKESYRLIRRLRLWFDIDTHPNRYTLWQNFIELSSEFANDLRKASVPIDLQTVRGLKESPGALDLYAWQAWRSFRLAARKKPSEVDVPVFGEGGLLAQLGTATEDPWKARQLLRRWQESILQHWPECPNTLSPDATTLTVRPAVAVNPRNPISLPGVKKSPPVPLLPSEEIPDIFLLRDADDR
jgi:hypothetical protein